MEKRLLLAVTLSVLIILSFQYFFAKPISRPLSLPERTHTETAQKITVKEEALESRSPTEMASNEQEFEVETGRYILTFSNIGGAIKKIGLKDYKNSGSGEPLELVEIKSPRDYIFAVTNPQSPHQPVDRMPYELTKKDSQIIYSLKSNNNVEVIKSYNLSNPNSGIELQLQIRNTSNSPLPFVARLIGGSGILENNIQDKRFVEVISKLDGKIVNFKNPKDQRITTPGTVNWTALKNKYFSIILKPFAQTKNQFYNAIQEGSFLTGVEAEEVIIPPGSFIEQKYLMYIGPSKISDLKNFGFEFEETVNYGFFGGIAKALLVLIGFFYSMVHNWGVAIIILSVFLNIVLFPLTLKSLNSMKKMQALQPQIEKLKEQCKGNAQKLNKEMLELYKKYKINPFGGCLPLLLQMPIFVALYQAIMKSIDLRGASFLWIKDLSLPDAVKIPVTLPLLGNSINILPILMIIGMIFQQKISSGATAAVTEEQKQQQKMMLILMPVMFGFIFYNMPSGLVLYWLCNTILTIAEQSFIFRPATLTNEER